MNEVVKSLCNLLDKGRSVNAGGNIRKVLLAARRDLKYCLEVFDETCNCNQCGPCRRKKTISKHVEQVSQVLRGELV